MCAHQSNQPTLPFSFGFQRTRYDSASCGFTYFVLYASSSRPKRMMNAYGWPPAQRPGKFFCVPLRPNSGKNWLTSGKSFGSSGIRSPALRSCEMYSASAWTTSNVPGGAVVASASMLSPPEYSLPLTLTLYCFSNGPMNDLSLWPGQESHVSVPPSRVVSSAVRRAGAASADAPLPPAAAAAARTPPHFRNCERDIP